MGIESTKIQMFTDKYRCDECGEGFMERTGVVLTSNPPQYPHVCDKCGTEKTFTGIHYPCQNYREIE